MFYNVFSLFVQSSFTAATHKYINKLSWVNTEQQTWLSVIHLGQRCTTYGSRKPCQWPMWLAAVLLKNWPVWCFRRAPNGSIPVHSKVRYFRWFSIIRHTASFKVHHFHFFSWNKIIDKVAARCDFQAQNTPKWVCGRCFVPDPTGGAYSAPRPSSSCWWWGDSLPLPKTPLRSQPYGPPVVGPWPQKSYASLI